MSTDDMNGLLKEAAAAASARFWSWVAKRLQPHLEPTTSISHVNVVSNGGGTTFHLDPEGIHMAPGTKITGRME